MTRTTFQTAKFAIAAIVLSVLAFVAVVEVAHDAPNRGSVASSHVGDVSHPRAAAVGSGDIVLARSAVSITAAKTWAFTKCIVGVGAPIGVAIYIAANPSAWAWVLGRGALPASVGASASRWLGAIKNNCRYAIL